MLMPSESTSGTGSQNSLWRKRTIIAIGLVLVLGVVVFLLLKPAPEQPREAPDFLPAAARG